MKTLLLSVITILCATGAQAKTLVVYYSYTNNVATIVSDLQTQIDADVIRIKPAEKGLDYAANNYAIGSALIAAIRANPNDASSYPAIDPVEVDLSQYDTVIIGAPLWWSNMAAPLQTFLFQHGAEMAGKHIGLIVSSASSGISGVESDVRRLIPEGNFFSESLWIRSSQTSNCHSMIASWLQKIDYNTVTSIATLQSEMPDLQISIRGREVCITGDFQNVRIYSMNGAQVGCGPSPLNQALPSGVYLTEIFSKTGKRTTRKVSI